MLRKTLAAISQGPQKVIVMFIKVYQLVISPLLGPRCRFFPSCSDYACEALEHYGIVKGLYLTAKRLLRCHPGCEGGIDFLHKVKSDKSY